MKVIILVLFILFSVNSYSQWICNDSITGIDLIIGENNYILTQQGEEYFCGLTEDNEQYDFDYYLRTDDIVFFIAHDKIDSSQIRGFFKNYQFEEYKCWSAYLLWNYYDSKGVLMKTEFYDKHGTEVNPILFKFD